MQRFADGGLQKMFGGFPGGEQVAAYLKRRATRELNKLDEATLHRYLGGLEALMRSVRTGEEFEVVMRMTLDNLGKKEDEAA